MTDVHTHCREDKGDGADKADGGGDIDAGEKGKGHAHGQGVNAGSHRHGEHGLGVEGAAALLGLPKGFLDHIRADKCQKHEGDPMVDTLDIGLELAAEKVADEGHARLKSAKVQTRDSGVAGLQPLHRKALADGNGHGVHGQTDSQNEQFNECHEVLRDFM